MHRTATSLSLALFAAVFVLGGCTGIQLPDIPRSAYLFGPLADQAAAERLKSEIYPAQAPLGDDLDMVVLRQGGKITFINRTATAYRNVHIWLNQQYVGQVENISIGTNNTHSLRFFVNKHAEGFPVGGLLTPDRSFPIVLAELYIPPTAEAADASGVDGKSGEQGKPGNEVISDSTKTDARPPMVSQGRRHRLIVRDLDRHIMR